MRIADENRNVPRVSKCCCAALTATLAAITTVVPGAATPDDIRSAESVRCLLDVPSKARLVQDRTGLHDRVFLGAVGKHLVIAFCLHPFLKRK